MEVVRIPTENPKTDQWRMLGQLAYPTNVGRFLAERDLAAIDARVTEFVVGCIRQGEAYFSAARGSPLDISPLLLYYGATNLLGALATLLLGHQPNIRHHGMKIPDTQVGRIASVEIVPTKPTVGALQCFCGVVCPRCAMPNGVAWTVEEVLGSLPDLKRDFENCYPQARAYTIPMEIVRRASTTLERIRSEELSRFQSPVEAFALVSDFDQAYLEPQCGERMKRIVLYPRLGSSDIGIYSIVGQKHLEIGHMKQGRLVSPGQLLMMYMGLFALGHISRYRPELWTPFVRTDETGERLLVERFLAVCERYIPNLVLDVMHDRRYQFVYETAGIFEQTVSVTESDVRSILQEELTSFGRREV